MGFLSKKAQVALGLNVVSYDSKLDSGITPTPSQLTVVDEIKAWVEDSKAPVFGRLIGPAGTGK